MIIKNRDQLNNLFIDYFGKDRVDIKSIIEVYDENENNEDFPDEDDSRDLDAIIIHYPELTITNEIGENHKIKDLYVAVYPDFSYDGCLNLEFFGARMTYQNREVKRGYSHSHLPECRAGRWGEFCLGIKFNRMIDTLLNSAVACTSDYMLLVFTMLDKLVSTESIDGGPHHFIRRMYSSHNQTYFSFNSSDLKRADPNIFKFASTYNENHIYPFISLIDITDWSNFCDTAYKSSIENAGSNLKFCDKRKVVIDDRTVSYSHQDSYSFSDYPGKLIFNGVTIEVIYEEFDVVELSSLSKLGTNLSIDMKPSVIERINKLIRPERLNNSISDFIINKIN